MRKFGNRKSKHKSRKEYKMAVQAKAKGNGPATGMPKTPAPDAISAPRSGNGQGYGSNGPVGNSPSVEPGKRALSPLAQNLESSVDDDGVQAHVIARGAGMSPDFQTRAICDKGYPAAHGHASRTANGGSPGGTIPAKLGTVQDATPTPGYGRKV
jgi:hypothetical protein